MFCRRIVNNLEVHQRLLKHVRNNNTQGIEKVIYHYGWDLLSHKYKEFRDHNILIVVCNDYSFMVKNDVKNEKRSMISDLENVKKDTIKILIKLGAKCTEPTENDRWEAIHYASITTKEEKLGAIIESLTREEANSLVYCSEHIPIYYKHARSYPKSYSNNALHILLKYGNKQKDFRKCCELLIQKGVRLDQEDSNGVTPLKLMKEEPELRDLVVKQSDPKRKLAFELVASKQEETFCKLKFGPEESNDVDGLNEDLSSCTLLQLCCFHGLTSCVDYLLKNGASPSKTFTKNRKSPIMIAIKKDYEDIVKLLLQSPNLRLPNDILIKIQTKYEKKKPFSVIDKYMGLVLDRLKMSDRDTIRRVLLTNDDLKRTALHYAVTHHRSEEVILELLSLGSPLTKKDIFGYTPMQMIEPPLLEKFFDSCVGIPKEPEGMSNMLYTLQNQKEKFQIEVNYEAIVGGQENEMHESEFLQQLIKVKKLTFLLNHPVISSYLEVKWQKFRRAVLFNLLLYFIAYITLLFYGFAYDSMAEVSNSLILTSLVLTGLREFFQLLLFRSEYLKRVDNLVDLVLIAGIIYILASGWVKTLNDQNLRVAFSIVFLSSTLGIFLQLGNLPFFSIKVIILRHICISFFKYMIFYLFPLLAFFFCFYMLRETTEDVFFQTLYDVVSMFAGDPDSEYPQRFTTNPIFSHIIYVCFIVLIGIILQNLLIGLAVNDLQEITKEAEFVDKKERASYITNIERVLFSKHQESSRIIFKKMFQKLLKLSNVFHEEYILVIQPYNHGCVYLKEDPETKQYIKDQNIIFLLQNIFKDLTDNKNKDGETLYSLKSICDRLERIEKILGKLDMNSLV